MYLETPAGAFLHEINKYMQQQQKQIKSNKNKALIINKENTLEYQTQHSIPREKKAISRKKPE